MNLSPDQWTLLKHEVEHQGGAVLPEKCEGELLTYKVPGGGKVKTRTCTCGNESMLATQYDVGGSKKQRERMLECGAGFSRVCAVCDSVGAWPRFKQSISEDDE